MFYLKLFSLKHFFYTERTGAVPKQKFGVNSYSYAGPSSSSSFRSNVSQKPEIISDFCRELLKLQDEDVTPNPEPFDCPICFATIESREGVILKNCLHTFCKECLNGTVKYNDKAEVVCPYKDDVYSCECILQDQEIRGIASKEVREEHIWRSLELAEMITDGSFHCQTQYCFGWWIVSGEMDNELVHNCPVCHVPHCIPCNAIHKGLSCAQFKVICSIFLFFSFYPLVYRTRKLTTMIHYRKLLLIVWLVAQTH